MNELEARLVYDACAQHCGFGELNRLIVAEDVIAARGKIEAAQPGVADVAMQVYVTQGQRISVIKLIIHSRVDRNTALRRLWRVGERVNYTKILLVERDRIDDGAVVNLVPPDVQKEGRSFVERAAQIPAVFLEQERRFLLRIRVA